jgi:hypothetical protein
MEAKDGWRVLTLRRVEIMADDEKWTKGSLWI